MVKHEKDCFITLFKTPTNELQNKANFIIAIYLDTLLCMSFQRIHIRVGEVIDADECLTEVSSFNRVRFTTVFFFFETNRCRFKSGSANQVSYHWAVTHYTCNASSRI